MPVLIPVAAPCGTCDHSHSLRGCAACQADGKECLGWTDHPEAKAAADERELRELADLDGQQLIDVDTSDGLLRILIEFEKELYAQYADKPVIAPQLAAIQLGPSNDRFNVCETVIAVAKLDLDPSFWEDGFGTRDMIGVARQWLTEENSQRLPTIAWVLSAFGSIAVSGSEGPPQDAHLVHATDIDGRTYTVAHLLKTNERQCDIRVAPGWAKLMRGELNPTDEGTEAIVLADGLSDGHMATTQLMLVTRVEMERASMTPMLGTDNAE
jgi:hypothetical protein